LAFSLGSGSVARQRPNNEVMRSSVGSVAWQRPVSNNGVVFSLGSVLRVRCRGIIFVKNKCEVEYTPFLSLLCPWRLDGLRAGQPELDSREGQDVSLLHNVQTGSGAHPASYPVSTGGSFSGGKKPLKRIVIIFLYTAIIIFSSSFFFYIIPSNAGHFC
jgi:hypothetical protein